MALSDKTNLKMLWEEDGKDMINKISIKKHDVLLMYIRMPEMDVIDGIQLIQKEYDDQQMISKMMGMGTNTYIRKLPTPRKFKPKK